MYLLKLITGAKNMLIIFFTKTSDLKSEDFLLKWNFKGPTSSPCERSDWKCVSIDWFEAQPVDLNEPVAKMSGCDLSIIVCVGWY